MELWMTIVVVNIALLAVFLLVRVLSRKDKRQAKKFIAKNVGVLVMLALVGTALLFIPLTSSPPSTGGHSVGYYVPTSYSVSGDMTFSGNLAYLKGGDGQYVTLDAYGAASISFVWSIPQGVSLTSVAFITVKFSVTSRGTGYYVLVNTDWSGVTISLSKSGKDYSLWHGSFEAQYGTVKLTNIDSYVSQGVLKLTLSASNVWKFLGLAEFWNAPWSVSIEELTLYY